MRDKHSYRENGSKPRASEELWERSPMNPKNRKEDKDVPNKA